MIEIEGKIVSADLLREKFACDLSQCKGMCCIEGDAGAPLEIEEVDILEEEYENYKPYMTAEGIKAVEEQGFMVVDSDGDYTTPLINGGECAFTCYDENGVALCAIDKAYLIEVNSIPGMSSGSIVPKQARTAGFSLGELYDKVIADTMAN